jgi:antagonist of KipI
MGTMTVVRPGMLTTVQDLGRWGRQHLGVPVAGPMDWYSHRLANARLRNEPTDATLEITLLGPELLSDAETVCVVAGAEFEITVGERRVRTGAPFVVHPGERVRFGNRVEGSRATLAVSGGFAVPTVLGSRSTSLTSRLGPFGGRALRVGDVLPIGAPREPVAAEARTSGRSPAMPRGGARLRVMMGPHDEMFSAVACSSFAKSRYIITPESNRMGYRLDGLRLDYRQPIDMLSDATPIGSLQIPPSGLPILLMADRQTTGGYPKIATVITADLPVAGQLAPGDWVEFEPCSRSVALEALRRREAALMETHRER